MRSTLVFFFLSLFFLSERSFAQIEAPDFLCVNGDTLVWQAPTNPCGPFLSYLVFGSQNINGPYALLSTITDPAQTEFFHQEAAGNPWFYYLQSDLDCPGQSTLSSDTLDNRIPEVGSLVSVSVDGDAVIITWNESPSPEVFGYIISRNTQAGTTELDTVFNGTTYIDTGANPRDGSETYFVVAIDECGNKSLVDDPHNTIFLEIDGVSECDQSISMSWNQYQNWNNGIGSHEIWLSINGAAAVPVDTISGTASSYTFEGANDMDEYCFIVRAVELGTMVGSNSNQVCETVDIIQPIRELFLESATVLVDNTVELSWLWNANAEINQVDIRISSDNMNFSTLQSETPTFPLNTANSFIDQSSDPSSQAFFYTIGTVDNCDTVATSNRVSTIYLQAFAQPDQTNLLSWTPYFNEQGVALSYEVYRSTDGGIDLLATYDATISEHVDVIDIGNPDQTSSCYFVEVLALIDLPDGSQKEVRSRSNIACVEQRPRLFIPNAFAPRGINTIFRPKIQFGTLESYSMVIYDRYGQVLFESTALEIGWDGTFKGKLLPQGIYVYSIKVQQLGGILIEEGGTVMLLR